MDSDSRTSDPGRDFFSIAHDLKMLSSAEVRELEDEARARGLTAVELVLQKGALDTIQVDIVTALLHPRDTIPGYEILNVLGRGGMGVVYRARQINLDRLVALKTILLSQTADPASAARFRQEALAIARLKHPNIVSAIDLGQHAGRLYFAMEYVDGENAEQYVRRRERLSESEAFGLVRQVVAGLSHAAEAGIVHRDIKPANLLVVDPPHGYALPPGLKMVKIADFGLAFLASEAETRTRLTAADTTVGSPHYIAPEQLESDDVDQRADIYSLGATLYHLLAGFPPFRGKTLAQIVTKKLSGDLEPIESIREDLSPAAAQLVSDMLARSREARPQHYADLFHRLDALKAGDADTMTVVLGAARQLLHEPESPEIAHADTRPIAKVNETAKSPVEEPKPAEQTKLPRRRVPIKLLAVAASIIGASALGIWTLQAWRQQTPQPSYLPTPRHEYLFDGESMAGWRPVSGAWSVDQDDEGGRVLNGENGIIVRPFGDSFTPTPLPEYYAISLSVRLRDARLFELGFAALREDNASSIRVLQVTPDSIHLGVRMGLGSESIRAASTRWTVGPIAREQAGNSSDPASTIVRLERQPEGWFAFVDDQQVAWSDPGLPGERPELWIRTTGGKVWLSDVVIEELAPSISSP